MGAESIRKLRADLDDQKGGKDRGLVVCVDGGYTNGVVFRNIRIEQASLAAFVKTPNYSRHRFPKELDADGDASTVTPYSRGDQAGRYWRTVEAYATGKLHQFDVKVVRLSYRIQNGVGDSERNGAPHKAS